MAVLYEHSLGKVMREFVLPGAVHSPWLNLLPEKCDLTQWLFDINVSSPHIIVVNCEQLEYHECFLVEESAYCVKIKCSSAKLSKNLHFNLFCDCYGE